jgi:hypothetical protein
MKRSILLSAVLLAFVFPALAQNAAHSSKSNSSKTTPLTGCVSPLVNSEGNYILTNSRYKKGVELIPGPTTEDISTHAGHEVQLTGTWTSEPSASKSADARKYDKHFLVASIQHLSDTCPTGSDTATPK